MKVDTKGKKTRRTAGCGRILYFCSCDSCTVGADEGDWVCADSGEPDVLPVSLLIMLFKDIVMRNWVDVVESVKARLSSRSLRHRVLIYRIGLRLLGVVGAKWWLRSAADNEERQAVPAVLRGSQEELGSWRIDRENPSELCHQFAVTYVHSSHVVAWQCAKKTNKIESKGVH